MIDILKQNLSYILAVLVPAAFFLVGLFVKRSLGQRDFHFFGGDLCFTGSAILASTALRQIYLQKLIDTSEIVLAFLAIGTSLALWYICLVLGRPKILRRSVLAVCIGTLGFYLWASLSWRIIEISIK